MVQLEHGTLLPVLLRVVFKRVLAAMFFDQRTLLVDGKEGLPSTRLVVAVIAENFREFRLITVSRIVKLRVHEKLGLRLLRLVHYLVPLVRLVEVVECRFVVEILDGLFPSSGLIVRWLRPFLHELQHRLDFGRQFLNSSVGRNRNSRVLETMPMERWLAITILGGLLQCRDCRSLLSRWIAWVQCFWIVVQEGVVPFVFSQLVVSIAKGLIL